MTLTGDMCGAEGIKMGNRFYLQILLLTYRWYDGNMIIEMGAVDRQLVRIIS